MKGSAMREREREREREILGKIEHNILRKWRKK